MNEQMEKLVEEIYQELSCVSWGFHRKDAEELIVRIGKAYADGELKLPGEVGRGKGRSSHYATGLNIVRLEERFVVLYSCEEGTPLTLIALCKEDK